MRISVKILWTLFLGGMSFFFIMLLLINFNVIGNMVSLDSLENPEYVKSSVIIGQDHTVLGDYHYTNRSYVDYDSLSEKVINAVIATEDVHFFSHPGITRNYIFAFPTYLLVGKGHYYGTISQQLARRLLVNNGGIDIAANQWEEQFRDMQEFLLTMKLERRFTKREILALYLNTVLFSNNIYGIENAARTFFNKHVNNLSLEEAATLIGMLKGRNLYNPCLNPGMSLNRRNTVIELMQRHDFITEAEAEEAKCNPIILRYKEICESDITRHFKDLLRKELETWAKEHTKADGSKYNIYEDGLKIYTTIRPEMSELVPIYIVRIVDRYGNVLR